MVNFDLGARLAALISGKKAATFTPSEIMEKAEALVASGIPQREAFRWAATPCRGCGNPGGKHCDCGPLLASGLPSPSRLRREALSKEKEVVDPNAVLKARLAALKAAKEERELLAEIAALEAVTAK